MDSKIKNDVPSSGKKRKTKAERQLEENKKITDSLSIIPIQTFEKRTTIYELIQDAGIRNFVSYYNVVELTKKAMSRTGNKIKVATKVFDYGIVFNNGVEIRHVKSSVINQCKKLTGVSLTIKKRERVPDYRPLASKQTILEL